MSFADDPDAAAWQAQVMKRVGHRVRAAREDAGLSQAQVAEKAGLTRPSIANLEGGRQDVPLSRLALIARAVGADLTQLLPEAVTHAVIVRPVFEAWCETCRGQVGLSGDRLAALTARRDHIADMTREALAS